MRANQSNPDRKRQRRFALAAIITGLGLSILAPVADVVAQSREMYLGSTGSRERDSRGPGYPAAAPRAYGYGTQRQQSETDGLLEDALEDLARGRILAARRLLELVIVGFPQSRSADEARRLLAPIYAGNGSGSGRTQGAMPSPGQEPLASAGQTDPIRPAFNPAPEPERDAAAERQRKSELARLRSLDQDFRSNVGDRIFFSEASADLGARSRVVLAAQAAWLKRHPDLTIVVEAHADDHGGPEFNTTLAQRRADAVHQRLIDEGVAAARIRVSAYGQEKPVATCSDAACAAQNRRVITQIETDVRPATATRVGLDPARRN